jgi:phosphocarrier protein HPr
VNETVVRMEMVYGTVKVLNPDGIHLRLAGEIVKACNKYESEILISKDGQEVNAKSILGVAGLGARKGSELDIRVDGKDEKEAFDHLVHLFESNFSGV